MKNKIVVIAATILLLFNCGKNKSVNSIVNEDPPVVDTGKFVLVGYFPKGVFLPSQPLEDPAQTRIYTRLRYVNFSDEVWIPTVQGGALLQGDSLLSMSFSKYCEIIGEDAIGYNCYDRIDPYSNLLRYVSMNYWVLQPQIKEAWWFSWRVMKKGENGELISVRAEEVTESEIAALLTTYSEKVFNKIIGTNNLERLETR